MRDTSTFMCPGQCSLYESSRDLSQVAQLLAVRRNSGQRQQQASVPPGLEVTSWSSWMREVWDVDWKTTAPVTVRKQVCSAATKSMRSGQWVRQRSHPGGPA
jgi:hypothetical protein